MKRIIFIATVVAFAAGVGGLSQPAPQTSTTTTKTATVRSVQVNSRTITALPKAKKYIVDLTRRGVRYEFDARRGRVDFTRVMVRTAQGEEPIGSFLKKVSFKNALTGFRYTSQPFTIGTLNPSIDRRPPPLTTTSNFKCDANHCACKGMWDCMDLIYGTNLCRGDDVIFCGDQPDGESFCYCVRA